MIYFDTSFLAPLILPESTSDKVTAFVRALSIEEQVASHWTTLEFSSLVSRKVRMGDLDVEGAASADIRFEAMMEEFFAVFLPTRDDFDLAKRYLMKFETGLRAADALHLAVASNHHATAIYTLDKRLITAGKMLGLPAAMGITGT